MNIKNKNISLIPSSVGFFAASSIRLLRLSSSNCA